MKIANMLHFTEHHQYAVKRDFSLSALDYKILTMLYQPMIGAYAVSLYYTLYYHLSSDKTGKSSTEQQRKLFLSLDLDLSEKGRKYFIEQTSKLEAVGLLQTSRQLLVEEEEYAYEYELYAPLNATEFFRNQHLILLLRDKVGKFMLLSIKEELFEPTGELHSNQHQENLSIPFYDFFRLNTQVIDHEIEEAFLDSAATTQGKLNFDVQSQSFLYSDIITRFPRQSINRNFVEELKFKPAQMVAINLIAKKYSLTLQETCRLLDEDGIFTDDGDVFIDRLQYNANLLYRQDKKREENRERIAARMSHATEHLSQEMNADPPNQEKSVEMAFYLQTPQLLFQECTDHQYNYMLRNESYLFVLKKFFPKGAIPDGVLSIFEKLDFNYKLSEEVMNVLIHFIYIDRRSWSKASIEAVASDMLGKQITTYELAVHYVREKIAYKAKVASKVDIEFVQKNQSNRSKPNKQKPQIPVIQNQPQTNKLTDEELDAMRRRAKKLDEKFNR